jgi:hypothetical protein
VDQSGDQEPGYGLGRQPEGGWPDFRAPDESGPTGPAQQYGPNQYGPNQYGQPRPPAPGYAQPWQQGTGTGRNSSIALFVIIGTVVVAMIVAIAVILATRNRNQPQPVPKPAPASTGTSTRPTSSAPGPSSPPATDQLAKALQETGLECVRANADPVINLCESKPAQSFTEVRWLDDDDASMISFQIYAKYQSDRDRMYLTKRVQMLQLAGLGGSDISRITRGLARAKKHTSLSDLATSWGSVQVQYIDTVHSVQLLGDKHGHSDVNYDGKVFDGKPGAIKASLVKQGYHCTLESQALTCSHGEAYLSLYGNGKGMTTVDLSGRSPAADNVLLDLLPTLLGGDLDAVRPLVENGMKGSFYLGAVSGYVVLGNTNYLSVEAISW